MYENLTIFVAFFEGIVSFLSPCVIPLLPIYLGYLSGKYHEKELNKKQTFLCTCFFILGIFIALFLLNISVVSISKVFQNSTTMFVKLGGIIIILLGVFQLNIIKIPTLQKTFRIQMMNIKSMNPWVALILGFTFSFSWTPCIGPALGSILLMASNSDTMLQSILFISAYAFGFTLPFLIIAFFVNQTLDFVKRHFDLLQVIQKIGAIILIVMGILMVQGNLGYLGSSSSEIDKQNSAEKKVQAIDFELEDQFGNIVSLKDMKDKVVFLNFWGTWCRVCKQEIADIQKLYETYKDSENVAILTVVMPNEEGGLSGNKELNTDGVKAFLNEHNITYPVLFDNTGSLFYAYGIRAFPTVFLLTKDHNVFGYLQGGIPYDTMVDLIQKTIDEKR